jgi:hypothetical protein
MTTHELAYALRKLEYEATFKQATVSEKEAKAAIALEKRNDDDIIQSYGPRHLSLDLLKAFGARADTVKEWYNLIDEVTLLESAHVATRI